MKANLTRANLAKTDLTQAVLSRSDFRGADLKNAQMLGCVIYETVFGDTDLTAVQGLRDCLHHGPSTIDHRTINKSGAIPLEFLRGCGLPDEIIIHFQALFTKGLRTHTCLISYAKQDRAFAEQLHDDLQDQGIRCWLVPDELKGGQDLQLRLSQALGRDDKLVLILSDTSMASDWIASELKAMRELENRNAGACFSPLAWQTRRWFNPGPSWNRVHSSTSRKKFVSTRFQTSAICTTSLRMKQPSFNCCGI